MMSASLPAAMDGMIFARSCSYGSGVILILTFGWAVSTAALIAS